MILQRLFNLYFVLDNVMYWEAFRWERLDMGYIYIQKFPKGKMYAGQTINLTRRMNDYRRFNGSNSHHTRALKKYIDTMQISFTYCPKYLLDDVETFVIAFFDLTDKTKGYNKTTGGRKYYRHSKDVLKTMSESKKGEKNPMFGRSHTKEARAQISAAQSSENHRLYGKTVPEDTRKKMSISHSGENNHMYGKTHTKETRAKISEKNKGENHPNFGKTLPEETCAKLSESMKGEKNHNSKPICAFGKLYGSASIASDTLRDVCNTAIKGNFMKDWATRKKISTTSFTFPRSFTRQ
ncbi:GIY-YIG catalytic domain-containing endonuclease [Acanthocystis turfacea Chlorella virus MN0810.1]|nr:GIY-YIG catalytic domain-containing endonuclease [Acanthocystis turfacea Chlorella virus MN0810.1]